MAKSGNSSDNPNRKLAKKNWRSKSTIMRLNMYKGGKAVRDKTGKVISGPLLMNNKAGGEDLPSMARIAPNRKWFGNTRTISSNELSKLRDVVEKKTSDPFSVLIRHETLPISLLSDSANGKSHPTNVSSNRNAFEGSFASKSNRKRAKITANSLLDFKTAVDSKYSESNHEDKEIVEEAKSDNKEDIFSKGQSKRIWTELYKVLDSSDVILEVVDARDVLGTRCEHVEKYIKTAASVKHIVIVLNKCDLVPSWVTKRWISILSTSFPVIAFHSSLTNSFGKGTLISLLRQFAALHTDKRQISVGVVGYPNTGKSSVINTLLGTNSCKSAPVPGETKIWQYVTLMRRIYLIDSPGIVYDVGDTDEDTVLKGVVRAERLTDPVDFVKPILERVREEYIVKHYKIGKWNDHVDFLQQLACKCGRLGKRGEPDTRTVAINVINDWQRGVLPHFVPPPHE